MFRWHPHGRKGLLLVLVVDFLTKQTTDPYKFYVIFPLISAFNP